MKLSDISITELARLLKKSRPTVYKYVTDYNRKCFDAVPNSVKELFDKINGGCSKSEMYAYCESNFFEGTITNGEVKDLINLILENQQKIDLKKLEEFIRGEIENAK